MLAAGLLSSLVGVGVGPTPSASASAAPTIQVRVGDAAVPEGDGTENGTASMAIRLSAPFSAVHCVWYHTVDGSATGSATSTVHDASHDYQSTAKKLVKIPANTMAWSISTTVLYDAAVEGDETFSVVIDKVTATSGASCLTAPVDADLADDRGTVTILDDDPVAAAPTLSVGDGSVIEGSGTQNGTVLAALRLSSPPPVAKCVWYHTENGSATGAATNRVHDGLHDYLSRVNTFVTIPANRVVGTISSTVLYDGDRNENRETFTVVIDKVTDVAGTACSTTPDGVTAIRDGIGTMTIVDDDGLPPSEPHSVSARRSATVGSAELTWAAPSNDGGATVESYEIQVSADEGATWTHAGSSSTTSGTFPCGLPAITCSYRAMAKNAGGVGPASWPSNPITTPHLPGPITSLVAVDHSDPGSAYVLWGTPWDDGGAPILDYYVEYSDDGGVSWTAHGWVGPKPLAVIPGLTGGATYVFRVTAKTAVGLGPVSDPSNALTLDGSGVPDAPPNVRVTASSMPGWLDISWDAPNAHGGPISYYTVDESTDGGATYQRIHLGTDTVVPACCYDIGETVRFRVTARNDVGPGAGGFSAPFSIVADAPTNLSATIGSRPGSVDLAWTAPASLTWPVIYYRVETSSDGGVTWPTWMYTSSTAASTSLCCYSSPSSTRWRVFAVTGTGLTAPSAPSNTIQVSVAAPTSVTASAAATPSSVDLSWTAPTSSTWPVTNYDIESSSDGGATWNFVKSTGNTATAATLCCATLGSRMWRVTAVTGAGRSDASAPSNVLAIALDAPTNVTAVQNASVFYSVDLSWTAPVSTWPVSEYYIEFSDDGGASWYYPSTYSSTTTSVTTCCFANGSSAQFRVSARNAMGRSVHSAPSNVLTIHNPAYVDPATNVVVTTGSMYTAHLTWTAPASSYTPVTDYFIETTPDGGATWSSIGFMNSTATSADLCCYDNGSTTQFRVWTVTAGAWSVSELSSVFAPHITLSAPIASPGRYPGEVTLDWTVDSTWPVTQVLVERSSDGGTTWSVAIGAGGTSTWVSAPPGTYQWRLKAFNNAGFGETSAPSAPYTIPG